MPLNADSTPLIAASIYVALLLLAGYTLLCAVLAERGTGGQSGLMIVGNPVNRRHWAELFGLSFAAGSAIISLVLFTASLTGLKPSRASLAAIAIASATGLFILGSKKQLLKPTVPTPRQKVDPLFFLGIAAAVATIAAAFNVQARAAWAGLGDIDAFAIWMFKAKWVTLSALHPIPAVFHDPGLSYSHQDYPLGFPFLIAGLYALGGVVSEELAKTLLLPQYLALVAVVYSAIRHFHRRAIAVTVTAIFVAAPVVTKNAGLMVAETPLLLAYSASLTMLLRWTQTGSRPWLMLAGFFAAATAFTKNEGLALLPVIGVFSLLFALTRGEFRKSSLIDWCTSSALALILVAPWLIFRSALPRTHEDYGGKLRDLGTVSQNVSRLKQVIPYLAAQPFNAFNAGLIWYVLVITAVVGWRRFGQAPVLIFWAILLAQLTLYSATFVVTPWQLNTLLPMITPKLLVQTTPVVTILITLHLRPGSLNQKTST